MRISDWSSDVCSSDLSRSAARGGRRSSRGRLVRIGDDQHQRLAARLADADLRAPVEPRRGPGLQQPFLAVRMDDAGARQDIINLRSEEHTSELQSLMRISYAVFCLKKKNKI